MLTLWERRFFLLPVGEKSRSTISGIFLMLLGLNTLSWKNAVTSIAQLYMWWIMSNLCIWRKSSLAINLSSKVFSFRLRGGIFDSGVLAGVRTCFCVVLDRWCTRLTGTIMMSPFKCLSITECSLTTSWMFEWSNSRCLMVFDLFFLLQIKPQGTSHHYYLNFLPHRSSAIKADPSCLGVLTSSYLDLSAIGNKYLWNTQDCKSVVFRSGAVW